jgi:hypothetical protein
VASGDLRLKGSVREVGLIRDSDRYDSFSVTIRIAIKTEGKVSYEEAERLSGKFRREYLGKDVEFVAVSIPCPYCNKVLNSEGGLKLHIRQVHPERAEEIMNASRVPAKREKPDGKSKKEIPKKKRVRPKKRAAMNKVKEVKSEKPKVVEVKRSRSASLKPATTPKPVKPKQMTPQKGKDTKAKQLTLA